MDAEPVWCRSCGEWPCICGAIAELLKQFEESIEVSVVTYERSSESRVEPWDGEVG